MLRPSRPVAVLVGAAQILLGIVDGIRDIKNTYHPLRDAKTYLESRKNMKTPKDRRTARVEVRAGELGIVMIAYGSIDHVAAAMDEYLLTGRKA